MRIALIPPTSALGEFGHGNFHLLLSHLCDDRKYRAHYKRERREGSYLVLDNSAHEHGAGESEQDLEKYAIMFSAQEVVVPDVLFDAQATVARAIAAHEAWFESGDSPMKALNPRLMYVPQGRVRSEWAVCLQELVRLHIYTSKVRHIQSDFTLGVSKDYEQWDGGLDTLFSTYILPLKDQLHMSGVSMSVHLLGWGRDLWQLGNLARKYPWIRSVDSAKPFVYSLDKIMLDPDSAVPKYPTRPPNYFDMHLRGEKRTIARYNCGIFKSLAEGRL